MSCLYTGDKEGKAETSWLFHMVSKVMHTTKIKREGSFQLNRKISIGLVKEREKTQE